MEVRILSRAFEDFKEVLIAIYGGYSLVVKLRSVKAAMRVRFPLVTQAKGVIEQANCFACVGNRKGFLCRIYEAENRLPMQ